MITYHFTYSNPHLHYLDIKMKMEGIGKAKTYLQLPAWRPGRYQLANFSKNIQHWQPFDEKGRQLPFRKITKDSWEVDTEGIQALTVEYNYFAFKLDAGSTYLDQEQLYINPVNCALYDPERMDEACEVQLDIPDDYVVATAMHRERKNVFQVEDFQKLADTPLIATEYIKHDTFETRGTKFHLWFNGECEPDYDQIQQDFKAFAQKQIDVMGEFPAGQYHFLFQLPSYPTRHGVEHLDSTVMVFGPGYNLMKPQPYRSFLALGSHELFHAWNIKSIRPAEMTPYRFNEENYSHLGYVAEGVTTYYGDLFLLRSGVFDFDTYAEQFNKSLFKHFHNQGRLHRSVAESSFDTWLDGYEEGAPARKTSIYIKGMMVAFLLDIRIRQDTNDDFSLDEVMRRLYYQYAKNGAGFTEANLKQLIAEIAQKDYTEFFEKYIWGTTLLETPLSEALDYLGCGLSIQNSPKQWEHEFGMKLKAANNTVKIAQIVADSPAANAGLSVEDELIAINGVKIDNNIEDLFAYYQADTMEMTIFRNHHLRQIHLKADGNTFFPHYKLVKQSNPAKEQKARFKQWAGVEFDEEPYSDPAEENAMVT